MVTGLSGTTTTTAATPPNLPPDYVHRAAWKAGVLGALNVATVILAVRLTLLVSVGGAIYLTWLVCGGAGAPDPLRLAALGVYAAAVVVPLVWLASRR